MAGAASMVRNVFVYGSLLAPEVLTALLDRNPPSSPAVVKDFHRYSIKGHVYPAVLPVKGSEVIGKVLFDLTDKELEVLDEFEDVDYFKKTVEPTLLDTKELNISIASPLKANMYVWANSQDKNLYGDWDYEVFVHASFKSNYLPSEGFAAKCCDRAIVSSSMLNSPPPLMQMGCRKVVH
ncbi:unnamed protein product [Calypogeia fissa]